LESLTALIVRSQDTVLGKLFLPKNIPIVN